MSGAPGESHNYVAVLLPLNQNNVVVVVRDGSERALVSTLFDMALTILHADVKATSRAPFSHP